MEVVLLIVIAVVGIVLISKARSIGKNNLWGSIADKMNEDTIKMCKEIQEQEKKNKEDETNEKNIH